MLKVGHASDMEIWNQESNVVRLHEVSAKVCTHELWRMHISVVQRQAPSTKAPIFGNKCRPMKETSNMRHWSWINCIRRGLCTLICQCWSWSPCISYGLCTSLIHCRVWVLRISQTNSTMVCAHMSSDISCGLCASTKKH